jgi:hypothetical protein
MDIMMARQPRTTSNSINVKAFEHLFFIWGFLNKPLRYVPALENPSEKELQKRDCLTTDFPFGVCRSCPIKSLFHRRLRQVRVLSSGQNQHQPGYLQT